MFKKLLLVGCFLSMITSINAQTLSAGDIAIIGINYDAVPYEMTIVNLAPISSGTVVRITDYGYDETTNTFGTTSVANTSEGSITWTTPAMAAGTVTKISIATATTAPSPPIVTGLPGTVSVTGWTNTTVANSPAPAGGDNWFIFQGSSPTSISNFVFAWTNTFGTTFNGFNQPAGQFNVSGSGAPNNNNSYLPPSLTLGTTAIALNRDPASGYHGDNNVYTGILTGTKSVILAEICNVAKWSRSETTTYNIAPGGTSFPGTNPIFTLPTPNSVPTDITLSSAAINENMVANTAVGTLSSTDPDTGNTFTYTLVAGTGDTDNAAFNISGSSLRISAIPDFEAKSSYSVRVRTTDQGGLTFEEAFTITITNVNEAPTDIALSAAAANENVAANTAVGALSSTDPDTGNTFTYTLVAGTGDTDNAAFNISGSSLRISAIPDFEAKSSYSVRVRTTDQGGLTFEEAFTITITNVNEAPTDIALSAAAANENVAANTAVGALSSTDPDTGNTFTYILVAGTGDTDNAAFNISGSSLRISAIPDFEAKSSYSVRVRTTDQGGLNYEEAFTITITNVNEAPTDIALSVAAANENVVANTAVGALSSTDPDTGNTFTYTLVAGTGDTDNAAFNISGSSLRISAIPDFEAKSSYSVRIRTTDQGGLTFEEAFTITITNVNEAPTDIALSAAAANENVVANTAVGALSSTDPDTGNTFTYTLVAGTGDTDNAAFNISGSSLRISAIPDFEAKSSYSVRVRTTDQGGLTFEEAFTITITNVNEAPTDIALSAAAANENVVANTAVGALSSTDPDTGNTFTYTLVAGTGDTDNAAFNISGSNLRISAIPDFEAKSSYSVRVRTTDQGGLNYEEAFTVTITNVNEAPTNIALSATNVNENVVINWTVGALSSTDADGGNTFTYTLVTGAGDTDNAAFNISGSSLRVSTIPNFETKSSYSVRIRTTDQGGLTYEEAFTITVNDLCELVNLVTQISGMLTATQVGAAYQWYNCSDNSFVGTNSNTFTPTQLGDYKVEITIGSCTATSNCITVTTLDTGDFEEKSKFIMYPNPSKGLLNIQSDHDSDLNITNQLGQTIKTVRVTSDVINSINIESLADGIYFITEKKGSKLATHKLILKK